MTDEFTISAVRAKCQEILAEVSCAVVGKEDLLHNVLVALLADGHILLEDYPGLAKTLTAHSFAQVLGLTFRRIQFTPDLLPGDILGGYIFNRNSGDFELHQGPIFSQIVLADEINRASPKTQSALLEAMQERQVSLEGETMKLPEPFIVIATQNPIEYEGTFPLPEAQLDRFLVKLAVGYPNAEDEARILFERQKRKRDMVSLRCLTSATELLAMRRALEEIHVNEDLTRYIVDLVNATRGDNRVAVGSSPRGSLALFKLARAQAALDERDYVLPDDIKDFVHTSLGHRLILNPDLWLRQGATRQILDAIVNSVPVPLLSSA